MNISIKKIIAAAIVEGFFNSHLWVVKNSRVIALQDKILDEIMRKAKISEKAISMLRDIRHESNEKAIIIFMRQRDQLVQVILKSESLDDLKELSIQWLDSYVGLLKESYTKGQNARVQEVVEEMIAHQEYMRDVWERAKKQPATEEDISFVSPKTADGVIDGKWPTAN